MEIPPGVVCGGKLPAGEKTISAYRYSVFFACQGVRLVNLALLKFAIFADNTREQGRTATVRRRRCQASSIRSEIRRERDPSGARSVGSEIRRETVLRIHSQEPPGIAHGRFAANNNESLAVCITAHQPSITKNSAGAIFLGGHTDKCLPA
jgi:hypothetical protein